MVIKRLPVLLNMLGCVLALRLPTAHEKQNSTQQAVALPLADESPGFPSDWQRFCRTVNTLKSAAYLSSLPVEMRKRLLQIECTIAPDSDQQLMFHDLRNWSKGLDRKVSLSIECSKPTGSDVTAEINLPWPMKARNLVSLSVRGCTITGYMSEYHSVHLLDIPDELRDLEIKNSVILFNGSTVTDLVTQTPSSEADCGPVTLERYVKTGVTFKLDLQLDEASESDYYTDLLDEESLLDAFEAATGYITHTCNYTNLKYMEDSNTEDKGSYHFHLLTVNSNYPEVVKLNFSNAGITAVPVQLEKWSSHFPKLLELDLSHNHLENFRFREREEPVDTSSESVLTVNLRFNRINCLYPDDIKALLSRPKVFVDLTENPIITDCYLNSKLQDLLKNTTDLQSAMQKSKYLYLQSIPTACEKSHYYEYAYVVIPLALLLLVVTGLVWNSRRTKAAKDKKRISTAQLLTGVKY